MDNFSVIIIKHGALGDVVRVSYFCKFLKMKYNNKIRISWKTSLKSANLLKFNPYIDDIYTNYGDAVKGKYDICYSLDDELEHLYENQKLVVKKIIGAYLKDGVAEYCNISKYWFDMGLISKYGKKHADKLKKNNKQSHTKIFSNIFSVENVKPNFYSNAIIDQQITTKFNNESFKIGIMPWAGSRWKNKELKLNETIKLINNLTNKTNSKSLKTEIYLFGVGQDYNKNEGILNKIINKENIILTKTDASVLYLSGYIKNMNLMVTADTLCMHLAIAQCIPVVSFFTITSADEIDCFDNGVKIKSTSKDYCSYRSDADNSSITAEILLKVIYNYINTECVKHEH
jgi:heptosyltransferase II